MQYTGSQKGLYTETWDGFLVPGPSPKIDFTGGLDTS